MNILEYEAKAILAEYGVPVPDSALYRADDPYPMAPVVLKSQVHSGGRGKAGGVVIVREQSEIEYVTRDILRLEINGETPNTLLAEEILDIDKEFYLSLVVDRSNATIELVAHSEGGIEVESHDSNEFLRKPLTHQNTDELGEILAEFFDLESQAFALGELLANLLKCFVESDALMLEINPLVVTKQGNLVAGDCKMTLDNDASWRHYNWNFEQKPSSANFVSLDTNGTVATIANGAGLAMATVDAVKSAGFVPANFLDIGGGATVDGIVESFKSILEFNSVNAIIINIFGGIVRCDDVAEAILQARQQFSNLPKLYIRLSGNRSVEAEEILGQAGLMLYADLPSCLEELV